MTDQTRISQDFNISSFLKWHEQNVPESFQGIEKSSDQPADRQPSFRVYDVAPRRPGAMSRKNNSRSGIMRDFGKQLSERMVQKLESKRNWISTVHCI